jgi:hypothetical protein
MTKHKSHRKIDPALYRAGAVLMMSGTLCVAGKLGALPR